MGKKHLYAFRADNEDKKCSCISDYTWSGRKTFKPKKRSATTGANGLRKLTCNDLGKTLTISALSFQKN